jgi:hypothetical protein
MPEAPPAEPVLGMTTGPDEAATLTGLEPARTWSFAGHAAPSRSKSALNRPALARM